MPLAPTSTSVARKQRVPLVSLSGSAIARAPIISFFPNSWCLGSSCAFCTTLENFDCFSYKQHQSPNCLYHLVPVGLPLVSQLFLHPFLLRARYATQR